MLAIADAKLDLVKLQPMFFHAKREPELVDLPAAPFLVIDGSGSPDSPAFLEAVGALYGVAYGVKMACKAAGRDFKVPTFGGSWSIGEPGAELPREEWHWQLTMMMPDYVTDGDVTVARLALASKKKTREPAVHLKDIAQGLCVQAMHIGPYSTEQETIDRMEALMAERHLRRRGPHHEVYLGNPLRTKPEKLKTLLRLPVEEQI